MGNTNATPDVQIDLVAIQDEINKMSDDEKRAALLTARVRQKKQQKKQQGSGAQKAYQLRQRERQKLLKAEAIRLGIWDSINEEAEQKAEAELASEEPETVDVEG